MFWDHQNNFLEGRFYTTSYLGRAVFCEQINELFQSYGGIFLPEKWGTDDRTKSSFLGDLETIKTEWTSREDMKRICFSRKKPVETLICFSIERFARAKFNDCSVFVRDKYVKDEDGVEELLNFIVDLSRVIKTDYGFLAHTSQERRQSPVLTPAERLPGIYWANFFGRPYIEFFGREKLLATPCYKVAEINEDLILLLTAERPNAADMTERDEIINLIKEYLNQNAFAGPNFPDEPCNVPKFNFGDVRWATELAAEGTPEEKLATIRTHLQAKGYQLIEETNGRLLFRGHDKSIIVVDKHLAEISVDITGEFSEEKNRNRL